VLLIEVIVIGDPDRETEANAENVPKPLPLMATEVLPEVVPDVGLIDVMVGAAMPNVAPKRKRAAERRNRGIVIITDRFAVRKPAGFSLDVHSSGNGVSGR
jgi:hypothetical protein